MQFMLQELRLEFCSVSFYIGQWARRRQHARMRKSSLQRRSLSSASQSLRSFVQRLNRNYSLKNLEGSGVENDVCVEVHSAFKQQRVGLTSSFGGFNRLTCFSYI